MVKFNNFLLDCVCRKKKHMFGSGGMPACAAASAKAGEDRMCSGALPPRNKVYGEVYWGEAHWRGYNPVSRLRLCVRVFFSFLFYTLSSCIFMSCGWTFYEISFLFFALALYVCLYELQMCLQKCWLNLFQSPLV